MKTSASLILLLCVAQQLCGQCKPVYRVMPTQPPAADSNHFNRENYGASGGELSITTVSHYDDTTGTSDTITIHHYKDSAWVSYPPLYLSYNAYYSILRWNDRTLLSMQCSQFNNSVAPPGYGYTLLELRNGAWDSVPGSLVPTDSFQFVRYGVNQNGLYKLNIRLVRNTFNQYYHYAGIVSKYDSGTAAFNKVCDYISYSGPKLIGGVNRLLIAGIDTVNGIKTYGFAYIDGGTLNRNTDNRFTSSSYYYLDAANDHIYSIPYSASPLVLEYYTQLVSSRQTNAFPMKATGGTGVYDGKVVFVSFDQDENQYINVLCPGQTQWKSIVSQGSWYNQLPANSGFFYYDYGQKKVMVLDEGSLIEGYAFMDLDSNCTRDTAAEPLLKDWLVKATTSNYTVSARTDQDGRYQLFVVPGTYELSGPSKKSLCGPDSVVVSSINTTSNKNLPLLKPGFHDLRARLLNGFTVRWNDVTTYTALIENLGEPADSAFIEFNIDGKLSVVSADSAMSINGNKVNGQLKNLGYFDRRVVRVNAWIDTGTTKPDSIVCSNLMAYLYAPEKDSANNTDTVCQLVRYSYDPNHKTCDVDTLPVGIASRLTYTIEFQNEGNDDAHDVTITDLLSSYVNLETFQIIGASHPYSYTLNSNLLTITFKDIFLKPKKTNEPLSKGFFKYAITTRSGLKNKTLINNRAYIYFDLNQPVITNTSVVVVSDGSTGIDATAYIRNSTLSAYPNPSYGELNILTEIDEDVHIYNLEGRELMVTRPENGQVVIDISAWVPGIYFIRCGAASVKVIKE